jgi:hypothetical protein
MDDGGRCKPLCSKLVTRLAPTSANRQREQAGIPGEDRTSAGSDSFKSRSFTSFRMTNPLKCHSEHTEESAFTGTFAESLYWSTNMNHYPSARYLDITPLFS